MPLLFVAALFFQIRFSTERLCAEEKTPLKILILAGGHGFDEANFYAMFDKMPGISYDKAKIPDDMDRLAPGLEKQYDAVVSYDMNRFPVTQKQCETFASLLVDPGIPLIVFHHSLGGYSDWAAEYCKIAGGIYLLKETEIDGKIRGKSDYKHDLELKIDIADKNHPITKGQSGFTIIDEAYKNVYVRSDVHVLLTTENPAASKQIAWVHRYGKSPVFTILLGHDKKSYRNENLSKLLLQGIQWGVSQKY
ncbi:MAG: ThuA domain-containing protein [Planctomycetaceae bacterium]|nr:ThuA domain-containing protein [Planctomycetaceae bacterium]